jgi:predicted DsbA family dithiol-disulfide isomerase
MQVQIVSDVVCPWCRIGKKNLQTAAEQFTQQTGEPIELSFLPYLLDPIRPEEEGESFRDRFVNRKGISEEQMQQMFARVTEVGKQFGLDYQFENIEVAVNTMPAHELMELAPADKRVELMDALMTEYFERGTNIGEPDELLRIAGGVLGKEVTSELETPLRVQAMEPVVTAMIQQVQQAGIRGVPYTIIDGKYAVNGGQPPQVFLGALMQAWEANEASRSTADVVTE